jgi:ubiquinone/menaquinone biosynthesis C-methylase UbiE
LGYYLQNKKVGNMSKKEKGNLGFSKEYWDKNYSEPLEMDNIGNANEHSEYIKAMFNLEQIQLNSVIDLGFGLGYLFENVINNFKPIRAMGIEPSQHAFLEAKKRIKKPTQTKKFNLENTDLVSWAKNLASSEKSFDLGICTSVLQYLTDEEIKLVMPIMARNVKYLYFSVPTDVEYKRQLSEYEFFDEFSIHRKKEKYLKLIQPHFTIVSCRMLESKIFFDDNDSPFKEQLFRF